ncbi:MAG: aminotransferase class V-fold PLP-dependent enzyme [Bacteroidota bacterium]|nr:aminotransferase class V-fold PLP-dependent enzyme [Bacteroidota bacterium]
MISFYPGPSRVHDEIPDYVNDACKAGILSINHRSAEFMDISARTIGLLKQKLEIPEDYTIFYTSSATECWEIIAQSVIEKTSHHFFSGAFGKKWFEYTHKLRSGARAHPFGHNELIDVRTWRLPKEKSVICITQNETSNGTQVSNGILRNIRERYPHHLVAVDATSSMAGVYLDFAAADIWFASVQKCFGLPAGLALMVCSPAAMKKVSDIGERNHYNSLAFMADMMEKWQTPFTPNVLNIYLLCRVMDASKFIRDVNGKIENRNRLWVDFFRDKSSLQHFITNEEARSLTVIPVAAEETLVAAIKSRAKKNGFLLGEGYGDLKSTTFRIANFPAIRKKEIRQLMEFLGEYE